MPPPLERLWQAVAGPPKPQKTAGRARARPSTSEEEVAYMPEKTQIPPERPEEPVPSEETPGEERREPAREAARRAAEILAQALSEAETLLGGAPPEQPAPTPAGVAAPAQGPSFEEINQLIRTLTEHFDRALDRLTEERRTLIDEVQSGSRALKDYIERAQDRMDDDRRHLSEQVSSLARANERLEKRLEELAASVEKLRTTPLPGKPAEEAPPPAEREPEFSPGEAPLTLAISAVPGFQGLMEAQRALMRLPSVEGASVERYFDGEARIVLTLREPVTARELVDTLSQATGQQAEIEESRPDALRLRVRFAAAAP